MARPLPKSTLQLLWAHPLAIHKQFLHPLQSITAIDYADLLPELQYLD
jgi:hypothetical protein